MRLLWSSQQCLFLWCLSSDIMVNNYHSVRSMKNSHSKAQVSIEFIAGFSLFILIVAFIVFTAISVFSSFYVQSSDNAIREEGWTLSVVLMDYLKNGTRISTPRIESLSGCNVYYYDDNPSTIDDDISRANYTYFKELFNVDESNDFNLIIRSSPVIVTDVVSGRNKTGNMMFEGEVYMFELFNGTSMVYDSVSVSNSTSVVGIAQVDDELVIEGNIFSIDKIDSRGNLLILGLVLLDHCGRYTPFDAMSSKITRFTTHNNWITKIDVVYW